MDSLADDLSYLLEKLAPKAFKNLTAFSSEARMCRIGKRQDLLRPFSGVTAVLDFCAHPHKDRNDLPGGCTMVCSLNSVTILLEYLYHLALYNQAKLPQSIFLQK